MKHTYLSQVSGMVKVHKIPPELVINWDQALQLFYYTIVCSATLMLHTVHH